MRRVQRLAFALLALVWFQVPGSSAASRGGGSLELFLRSAATHGFPTTYVRRVAGDTAIGFGDPGDGALARYRMGAITLDVSFRDPESGGLLPMERLWEQPAGVGAVYHELFHAFFEREVATVPGEMAEFERQAQLAFPDVPTEKRSEVAEEAVGCWIESLIETAASVARRNHEAPGRGWPPVAQWDAQDLRALANGYEVHFRPRHAGVRVLPGGRARHAHACEAGRVVHRIRLEAGAGGGNAAELRGVPRSAAVSLERRPRGSWRGAREGAVDRLA